MASDFTLAKCYHTLPGYDYSGAPVNSKPATATGFLMYKALYYNYSEAIATWGTDTVGGVTVPYVSGTFRNLGGSSNLAYILKYLDDLSGMSGEALYLQPYAYNAVQIISAWWVNNGLVPHATPFIHSGRIGGVYGDGSGPPTYITSSDPEAGKTMSLMHISQKWSNGGNPLTQYPAAGSEVLEYSTYAASGKYLHHNMAVLEGASESSTWGIKALDNDQMQVLAQFSGAGAARRNQQSIVIV